MNDRWFSDYLAYSARTDVGMRRRNNQDSYSASPAASPRAWRNKGHLFVLADGMGAHAAGELASKLAATVVPQSYVRRVEQSLPDALRDAILDAHRTIRTKGDSDPALKGMGTTCDALVLTPGSAYVGHVGDSRVYRLRDHVYEQITFDHSVYWEAKYCLNQTDLEHVPKNVITRSLGPTDNLRVSLEGPFDLKPGDVFLMCSDGLSGQVKDSEMGQFLEVFQPEDATEALVNLSNLRGGPDNITVVVARIKAEPRPEDVEPDPDELQETVETPKTVVEHPPLSGRAKVAIACASASLVATIGAFCASGLALGWKLAFLACFLIFTGLFFFEARKTLFGVVKDAGKKDDRPLGRGPYVRSDASPERVFCGESAVYCQGLYDEVRKCQLALDWEALEKTMEAAKKDASDAKFASSIRANWSVINYLMRELRKLSPVN